VEYTGGIEGGSGEIPPGPREQKEAERNSQWHHQTPDAPPYREVTPGRLQELDQEATPGRRNLFHRPIRSKPKLQLLFALTMRFRIVFVRRPSSSCGLSYIPTKTNNAEKGTSIKGAYVGPFQGLGGGTAAIRRSNQTTFPLTKLLVLARRWA
jgi:hypothetical protein